MIKQLRLKLLDEEDLSSLWERFPEEAKREFTQQVARLMARAAAQRIRALTQNQEVGDEPRHD